MFLFHNPLQPKDIKAFAVEPYRPKRQILYLAHADDFDLPLRGKRLTAIDLFIALTSSNNQHGKDVFSHNISVNI